jgi:hypothetical protein
MSGVEPVRFDGQDIVQPGAYSKRNTSGLDTGSASGSRLLLLAESKGGIPFNANTDYPEAGDRVNWVSNTTNLKEIIRTGSRAYDGSLAALTPSNDPGVNGAPAVGVIRINKATRSSVVVKDTESGDVTTVYSLGYGNYTKQIQHKIEAGTNTGKKATVKFEGNTYVQDDVTNELFTVLYTGAGSASLLTLDPTGNLVIANTGAATDDITIDLTAFEDVNAIVEALNAFKNPGDQSVYTAVVIGDGAFKSAKLDKVIAGDAINPKAAAVTLKADLEAIITAYVANLKEVTMSYTGSNRRVPANMTSFEYLTGGSDGATPILQDWVDALSMAKLIDASFVLVATADAAVHAALAAHVKEMSSVTGKNERQGGCGCDLNELKATKIAAVKAINSNLMGYFASEVKRYDEFGEAVYYPGYIGMCMIAGMSAGNAITFAPTNKSLNVLAIKETLESTDIDDYIKAGAIIAQPDAQLGGHRVVRSVTTYQGTNKIDNEWSATRTILFVSKDHRAAIQSFIGKAGDNIELSAVETRARVKLDDYIDAKYFVVDSAKGNAWRNFVFTVTGDVVEIGYEGTIVLPINNILVTHNFTVIGFAG